MVDSRFRGNVGGRERGNGRGERAGTAGVDNAGMTGANGQKISPPSRARLCDTIRGEFARFAASKSSAFAFRD